MRLAVLSLSALLFAVPADAAPKVITSIVPVHSIVSAVMGETGEPQLLLDGSMSEHRATFTPQQIARLGEADLVFIVGSGLEAKLSQMSGSEAVNGKTFISLSEATGVKTLPVRSGGAWETHDHGHDHGAEAGSDDTHEEHAEGILAFDPHVWLDPANAKAMAKAAADALSAFDPGNAALYAANAEAFAASLDAETGKIEALLAPVKAKPYIVFHDAFQYFEARFGLAAAGSIADVSARSPSAARLKEIRDKLNQTGAVCVFREPQFDSKVIGTVIEGSAAREGVLDPIGAVLTPGPGAYPALLMNLAEALKDCLEG